LRLQVCPLHSKVNCTEFPPVAGKAICPNTVKWKGSEITNKYSACILLERTSSTLQSTKSVEEEAEPSEKISASGWRRGGSSRLSLLSGVELPYVVMCSLRLLHGLFPTSEINPGLAPESKNIEDRRWLGG